MECVFDQGGMLLMSSTADDSAEPAGVSSSGRDGSVWVIRLRGDFDALTFAPDATQEAVDEALASFEGPVVFDLAALGFCDSSLLNIMIRARIRRLVALVAPGPLVRRMLELTGVQDHLLAYATLDEARTALSNPHAPDAA
ncbi:STAS domain-containing protein [Streptomyces sp. NPDC059980]|uniref:STAS domain-containing protein n=1 Tax=Streptomyces sp. NPDC059980 TaxID=3347022 RepID=UPI003683FA43